MKCLNDEQLKMLAAGRLKDCVSDAVLHMGSCAECRERLKLASRSGAVALGMSVIGVHECPEYDVLSEFIDGTLAADAKRSVEEHLGECELCFADVAHLSDLRAAAHLRGPVTVTPVKAKPARGFARWKLAMGGVVAGMIVAAFILRAPTGIPTQPNTDQMATKPPTSTTNPAHPGTKTAKVEPGIKDRPTVPGTQPDKTVVATGPSYRTILRDGNYSVAQADGHVEVLRGSKPASALEARLEAAIQQKIRSGKVKISEPVMVAMRNTLVHSKPGGYVALPTAPKLDSPVAKLLQSDMPSFKWAKVDMAERYRLVVTDTDGNPVFESITDRNSAQPDIPLKRGKVYLWRVGVRFGQDEDWTNSSAASFAVLSDRGFRMIESAKTQMPGSRLALAVAYESVGLYDEAKAQYKALERENPRSPLAARLGKSVQGAE